MDIRIINMEGELINVSRLSIKTIGRNLIGIDEKKNVVNIESCRDEEVAKKLLDMVVRAVCDWSSKDNSYCPLVISLNKEYKE